jgi:hypothetical protein
MHFECTVMIDEKFAYLSFFINCYYDQAVNVNKYALYGLKKIFFAVNASLRWLNNG